MTKAQDSSETLAGGTRGAHDIPASTGRRRGRPLGSKNKPKIDDLTPSEATALEESRKAIVPNSDVSRIEAVNRAQIKTAVQGGTMAQRHHLERIAKLEQKQFDAVQKRLEDWEHYVFVAEARLENARPEESEKLERLLLPHPHDVHVDWANRVVRFTGPVTTLERREWNGLKDDCEDLLYDLKMTQLCIWAYPLDLEWQAHYLQYLNKVSQTFLLFSPRHRPRLPHPWHELPEFDCEFHEHFVEMEGMEWDEMAAYLRAKGFPKIRLNSGSSRARAKAASPSIGLH